MGNLSGMSLVARSWYGGSRTRAMVRLGTSSLAAITGGRLGTRKNRLGLVHSVSTRALTRAYTEHPLHGIGLTKVLLY